MIRKRNTLAVLLAASLSLSVFTGYSTQTVSRADESAPAENVSSELADIDPDASDVSIDEKNFPDKVFREKAKEFDTDGNGKLSSSEISNVKEISCGDSELQSAKGVGFFTALERLNLNFCYDLSELDISKNTNLVYLSLQCSSLTSLDLSKNTLLETVYCNSNKLTSLDVTKLGKLSTLICSHNQLTSLDVGKNLKLVSLSCEGNKLSSLDVSKNTALQYISYGENPLQSVDTSKNTELTSLDCSKIGLTSLDLSENPKLMNVNCSYNKLTSLDFSKNTIISTLDISGNEFKSINVSQLTNLNSLLCSNNQLTSLDVSKNTNLGSLFCDGNKLTSLDLSKNARLYNLRCYKNQLSSLDVSKCTELYYLETYSNSIKKLDVSKCEHLVSAIENCDYTSNASFYAFLDPEKGDVIFSFDKNTEIKPSVNNITPTPKAIYVEPTFAPTLKPVTPPPANEGFENFVERLYKIALNREPEAEGKAFWVKHVKEEGATGADCARFFLLTAPEFMNRKLDNGQFLETLYSVFFDRASDASGKNYWLGRLSTGTSREEIVNGFIESTEWCNVCAAYGVNPGAVSHKANIASENAKAFATRLYTKCLGREPEKDGLAYWSLALSNHEKTAAEAAQLFFNSEEFTNFGLTEYEYLKRLYYTFMDREPDADGLDYWESELSRDKSRAEVLKLFAESPEFTAICKQYGIERGTLPQPPPQKPKYQTKTDDNKILVMSMSSEAQNIIENYLKAHPDVAAKYEFVYTVRNNDGQAYEKMLNSALTSGNGPDIYLVEADYALPYIKGDFSDFAAPYSKLIPNLSAKLKDADVANYTVEMGTNYDGKVVALSYQSTPGVFIYRRSIAKEVFGSDNPATIESVIGAGAQSWDKFLEACETLKSKGYKMVSGLSDIWIVAEKSAQTPWVVNGKLNIDPARSNYLDVAKAMIDNGYTNDNYSWSEPWYADMVDSGPAKVFGWFGPAWFINFVLANKCENAGINVGDFAVCLPPVGFWWGGSWILANRAVIGTEKQAVVADILNYITLDTSKNGLQYKWANMQDGISASRDSVTSGKVLKASNGAIDFLGGQNPFPVYTSAIPYNSAKCKSFYDSDLNGMWQDLANQYAHGNISKETAIVRFKDRAEELGIEAS
ncbi:MAG: DUF4214 domain-containing protein [Clostridiales bacterium]|nr:DUF4214 domain-containing protein [Clostridiales bacterium]